MFFDNKRKLSLVNRIKKQFAKFAVKLEELGILITWKWTVINVVVPVIDFDKQRVIADLVEESFKLKKQTEHLLEVAKTAVEMAIEKDEESALEFLNDKSY